MSPVLLLTAVSCIAPAATPPQAQAPQSIRWPQLEAPYRLPRKIRPGAFGLTADVTLEKLDGTAASVWIGDGVNFGFDGRGGRMFVEGRKIGDRPVMLAPSAGFIQAGKPFRLTIVRTTADGPATIAIGGRQVCSTPPLTADELEIRFRPHRNAIRVERVHLIGNVVAPPPLTVATTVIPLLIGEVSPVATLEVFSDLPTTIHGATVDLSGSTDSADVGRLSLISDNGAELTRSADGDWVGEPLQLPAGSHQLQLVAHISSTAPLDHMIRATVETLLMSEGEAVAQRREPAVAHRPPSLRLGVALHHEGNFDCHTTRIPGLVRTAEGTLLAVCDLRYNSRRDLQEDIDIGLFRSTTNGQTWEAPRAIMDMGQFGGRPEKENGCSDPNILIDRQTGEILVSAVWTHGKPNTHQWQGRGSEPGLGIETSSQFMMVRSADDGMTWTPPANLTRDLKNPKWWLFAPAPGNGITTRDNLLVMPSQGRDEQGLPFSNLMVSRDHGRTWTVSPAARRDTTECAVAELSDGRLMLNMRDNRNRADKSETNGRAVSVTDDLGQTWTVHASDHGALPEPVCMASLISYRRASGQHVLIFSNPHTRTARQRMTVQFSFDDGLTWPESRHVLLDEPGGAYSSLAVLDDDRVGILYESSRANLVFQTVAIPARDEPVTASAQPVSRILFGSCIKQHQPVPILGTILQHKPDLFVFLGDNIYADTTDMQVMSREYATLGANPDLQKLRQTCAVMATWDDHDYGLNDAGADYPQREASQKLFLDFWSEPSDSERRSQPGIYTARAFGPPGRRVQILLLDTRYFRSPLKKGPKRVGGSWEPDDDPSKTMLGSAQWRWLEQQLSAPAEVRIIATSIQAVAEDAGQETWSNLPHERTRLFDLIRSTHANGVVMISGDRHWSELSAVRSGVPYPLFDLTSSSLNQTHARGTPTENRFRVLPSTYHEPNFGEILIDWESDEPAITLQIRDIDGRVKLSHRLPLASLRSPGDGTR